VVLITVVMSWYLTISYNKFTAGFSIFREKIWKFEKVQKIENPVVNLLYEMVT
jgi:hypothetical protein